MRTKDVAMPIEHRLSPDSRRADHDGPILAELPFTAPRMNLQVADKLSIQSA